MKTPRIFLAALCAVILALVATPAPAATYSNLTAVTSTGAGASIPSGNIPGWQVHVYSAAGSSATVVVQGSLNGTVWKTLATITNPDATGEGYKGTAWPYVRANVTARASGTITAIFQDLSIDPGPWAPSIASQTSTAPTYGLIKYTWTNAEVVTAGTGGTSATITVGTLPANAQVLSAYVLIGTQATFAAGTLTVGIGKTNPTYVDLVVASDAKAAAGTIYGNAAAERGTDAAIQLVTTATAVKAIFTAGAGDLADLTTCTGTVYLAYLVYP